MEQNLGPNKKRSSAFQILWILEGRLDCSITEDDEHAMTSFCG